jgi:hypothetical protein
MVSVQPYYYHAARLAIYITVTTTEINWRGGSKASVRTAASAALPRVFLQRVSL